MYIWKKNAKTNDSDQNYSSGVLYVKKWKKNAEINGFSVFM
jgi:hypothetical protein